MSMLDDMRDESIRDAEIEWNEYCIDNDEGSGGPKSVIPIVIYVLLVIITSFMGGGLPAAVFGLVPLYVYYKC